MGEAVGFGVAGTPTVTCRRWLHRQREQRRGTRLYHGRLAFNGAANSAYSGSVNIVSPTDRFADRSGGGGNPSLDLPLDRRDVGAGEVDSGEGKR